MKRTLLVSLFSLISAVLLAQQSDFIVLKKRNNRTIKTYGPGSYLSAFTYDGFLVSGYIKIIRNDSIIVKQEETRLVPTQFGSKIDTIAYTIAIPYQLIRQFNYKNNYENGHKKGFAVITLPRLMMIGGAGYVILELVNTAYRKESLNENNKLPSLTVAAGIAATGFLWQKLKNRSEEAGGKYKVVYMKVKTAP